VPATADVAALRNRLIKNSRTFFIGYGANNDVSDERDEIGVSDRKYSGKEYFEENGGARPLAFNRCLISAAAFSCPSLG
jgi:hypothetical protein